MNTALLVFGIFFVCIFMGVPIVIALGLATIGTLMITGVMPMDFYIQVLFSGSDSFTLLAVPFFILVGEVMAVGGISKRLIGWAKSILGGVTGGLSLITILVCAIFAAICGSGPATVAAIGGIMIPAMIEEGYDVPYATTLAAAGGTLGPIIPPSISFVMYGVVAGVSISDLFIAGFGPGILTMLTMMAVAYYFAKRYRFEIPDGTHKFNMKEFLKQTNEAKWSLLIPVIILGGIYGGIFTPTEAAVVAATYGLIVSAFVYKELTMEKMVQAFYNTAKTVGMALIMVGTALAFGRLLTVIKVPAALAAGINGFTDNYIIVLLLINAVLFIAGMFMETIAAILIFTPLFAPIAKMYGVDLTHFGIILVFNLIIGQCTPPVGTSLYVASAISKIKIEQMIKWVIVFVGVLVMDLMFITYIPQISLFLVKLLA